MKFMLVKKCPDGSIANVLLQSEYQLREHLTAMWKHTEGYSIISIFIVP